MGSPVVGTCSAWQSVSVQGIGTFKLPWCIAAFVEKDLMWKLVIHLV